MAEKKIFFVGTAHTDGCVNLSPKGMGSLNIIKANQLIWLNLTDIVNGTATHLLKHPRMTLMFCSFEGKPLILCIMEGLGLFTLETVNGRSGSHCFPNTPGSRKICMVMATMHRPPAVSQFQALILKRIGKTWYIGQIK